MDDKLPPPIQVIQGNGGGGNDPKDDDSLIEGGFKVKNPFFKFFDWIKNFIKRNQNITIKIPIIGVLMGLGVGLGSGYKLGFDAAISKFFPNSSPILHRAISVEGIIQKSASEKYYLKSEDNLWVLKPKPPITQTTLSDSVNQKVKILGNLTKEANIVEVSEVILLDSLNLPSSPTIPVPILSPITSDPQSSPNPNIELPQLFSALEWVTNQKRTLIFTSGKRKIEQEGVYFESSQLNSFPQDFINYYIQEFKNKGFKETFNSISPDGVTITYAKDDLFLTFGTKNKYSGSGDKKQLVGYTAFIEHN